jgi:hypothetical protein
VTRALHRETASERVGWMHAAVTDPVKIARLRASRPLVGEFLRADFEFERAQRKLSSKIPASSRHAVSFD